MPRIMFYRLPVEGASNVFESEFGPIEYLIVEQDEADPAPDGWAKDHTTVYAAPSPAPKKRRKAEAVEEAQPEPEGE